MSSFIRPLLMVALVLGAAPAAFADDGAASEETPPRRSRARSYSNGPRRVPAPRGASQRRAEQLGLGTRRVASELMTRPPRDEWLDAARWRSDRAGATLVWPVADGRYGRGFGFTRRERRELRHDGIDIVAPEGSEVRAVDDGIVAYSDNGIRGYGNCVLIVHPGGGVSMYAHNYRNTVQPGWRVQRGERIALVGTTGISRGPHLHFEMRNGGQLIDPAPRFGATLPVRRNRPAGGVGSPALARLLLDRPAPRNLLEQAGERTFRDVLWPTRGGVLHARSTQPSPATRRSSAGIEVDAEQGTAVRAGADALVVYTGTLPGRGEAVVLLSRTGRVMVYGSVGQTHVAAGQTVLRGEWIAAVGQRPLRLEIIDNGRRTDPTPLLAQVPTGS